MKLRTKPQLMNSENNFYLPTIGAPSWDIVAYRKQRSLAAQATYNYVLAQVNSSEKRLA